MLTTFADDAIVMDALRAGARSYLTKDADRADIAQALRGAAAGLSVLDPGIQAALVAAAATGGLRTAQAAPGPALRLPDSLPGGLTRREAVSPVQGPEGAADLPGRWWSYALATVLCSRDSPVRAGVLQLAWQMPGWRDRASA